jgi:uncharacterized membrane protein YdjX (TVP38/TMEM64 family)
MINRNHALKAALLVLIVAGLFIADRYWGIASYFDPMRIKLLLEGAGALAPVIYMSIMALAVVVSPIPSMPLDIAAGAFFGPLLGTLYSTVGATVGAVASFEITRLLGRRFIERFLGGHINFCTYCSDRLLTRVVFVARLMPGVSFDIVSYGAGLTKISLRNFTFATFLGMIPATFFYNYFGSVMMFSKWLTVALGAVVVAMFFVIPRWVEKRGLLKGMHHEEKGCDKSGRP